MPNPSENTSQNQIPNPPPVVHWTREKVTEVLQSPTNPVFILINMRNIFLPSSDHVAMRQANVYLEMVCRFQRFFSVKGELIGDLNAEVVAACFDLIDREFCGSAITDVFRYHNRRIIFRIVGDAELPTQGGSFSRAGYDHFITINSDMIKRALSEMSEDGFVLVCGKECRSHLEVLQRILEHELAHLIVYTDWVSCDPHGDEFLAVAFTFFRHTSCTHALPLPKGVCSSSCEGHRDAPMDSDDTGVPTGDARYVAYRPDPIPVKSNSVFPLTPQERELLSRNGSGSSIQEQDMTSEDDDQEMTESDKKAEEMVAGFWLDSPSASTAVSSSSSSATLGSLGSVLPVKEEVDRAVVKACPSLFNKEAEPQSFSTTMSNRGGAHHHPDLMEVDSLPDKQKPTVLSNHFLFSGGQQGQNAPSLHHISPWHS